MTHKPKQKVPQWGSDEAIAQFWDTHDATDYWDEFEPANDVKFAKPQKQVISVRIEPVYLRQLKALAKKMGIEYSQLVRIWIRDKLRHSFGKARAS